MKNWQLLKASLTLCALLALLNGCNPGLQTQLCIVDAPLQGFDCVNSQKQKTFVKFADGLSLKCASPEDTEDFLKACENHQILPITLCNVQMNSIVTFVCLEPNGMKYSVPIPDVDNFVCMTDQDRKRVEDRCLAAGHLL